MMTDKDTHVLDRIAALNAARNSGDYGPITDPMDSELVHAMMRVQEAAVKALDAHGL
jgi:hypothetical protein